MIDPQSFQRAEVMSTLRQLKTCAQLGPPAAEHAGSALLAFSRATSLFVDAFEASPDASPREMLLAAGEAHAQLSALQRTLDLAMDQFERLPIQIHTAASEGGQVG